MPTAERPIAIAFEETSQGRDAVVLGRTFAELLAAPPLLTTVFRCPRGASTLETLDRAIECATGTQFDAPKETLSGLDLRTWAVVEQSVGRGLIEVAEAVDACIVVVGSCRRGRAGRTLAGSTADSLLHGVRSAVAVAPLGYGERPAPELRRLGVAYDGTAESRAALDTAIGFARRTGAELTLIGVADYPRNDSGSGYENGSGWSVLTEGELHEREREEQNWALREAATALVPPEIMATTRLLSGSPGRMLAQSSGDFDLLLVGSRAYGQPRWTLLGSTTTHLIGAAACPVLVLPGGAPAAPLGIAAGAWERKAADPAPHN